MQKSFWVIKMVGFDRDRAKVAKKIAKNLFKMRNAGFKILVRPQKEIAGIIFDIENEYHMDSGRTQKIAWYYDIKEKRVFREPLQVWSDFDRDFKDAIIADFDNLILLTSLTSHHPEAEQIFWLPPADAEYYEKMINEAKGLIKGMQEIKERNKKLSSKVEMLQSELRAERERVENLEGRIAILSEENAHWKGMAMQMQTKLMKYKSAITEIYAFLSKEIEKAKEKGEYMALSPLEQAIKMAESVMDLHITLKGVEEDRTKPKETEEKAGGVKKEIELPPE